MHIKGTAHFLISVTEAQCCRFSFYRVKLASPGGFLTFCETCLIWLLKWTSGFFKPQSLNDYLEELVHALQIRTGVGGLEQNCVLKLEFK